LLVYPAVDLEASARQPPEFADRLKQRYGLSNESILLCVARLDTDKGQDILLKALPLVLAEHPDAKLILVGEGPMYEELERLAVALKIEDSVIFTGEVPSDELAAFYTLCSFFVMPSRSVKRVEGFGIVYLEAALFQRTSVAGNQGGVPEAVIDGLTGLLVDPMSTEEVATGIIRLLDEPEFRETLAARAQDRVLSEFQIDHMAERLLREGSVFGQAGVGVGRRNVGLAIWAFQLAVVSYKGMIRDLLRKVWRFVIRKVGGS
jgi:phosphatidylinositol alpha-1,6-mannosyltransferase